MSSDKVKVFLRQCADCKEFYGCKTKNIDLYCLPNDCELLKKENRSIVMITHGKCSKCMEKTMEELEERRRKRRFQEDKK